MACSHDSLSGVDRGSPSRRQTRVAGPTAGLANRPQRSRQTRRSPHPARHKACTSASGRDRSSGCPSSLVLPCQIARSGCRWCGSGGNYSDGCRRKILILTPGARSPACRPSRSTHGAQRCKRGPFWSIWRASRSERQPFCSIDGAGEVQAWTFLVHSPSFEVQAPTFLVHSLGPEVRPWTFLLHWWTSEVH